LRPDSKKLLPPELHAARIHSHRHCATAFSPVAKRIRPILCYESAKLFAADPAGAIPVGCAPRIHSHLLTDPTTICPALDNDDLRRGKPTNHKVFGEAYRDSLAGDALLTLAFQTLANAAIEPNRRVRVISEIAAAAGTVNGMVGGQVADIEAEKKAPDSATLEYIHRSKTAALICGSIVAGRDCRRRGR